MKNKIITIGISPCWDIFCRVEGLEWGEHKQVAGQLSRPAGKALNVSRGLAWMGLKSTATGLWGRDDYTWMRRELAGLSRFVKAQFTVVEGTTRRNINIIDVKNNREMHLRTSSELDSKKAMKKLYTDLRKTVRRGDICVFAGSSGRPSSSEALQRIVKMCVEKEARLVVDTSGATFRTIVDLGGLWLIKPNVHELGDLLGGAVPDRTEVLVDAAKSLLDRVHAILISRGEKGAILVTRQSVYQGQCETKNRQVQSTLGCGDYMLAGFLAGWGQEADEYLALETSLKAATARAWGLSEETSWPRARRKIKLN